MLKIYRTWYLEIFKITKYYEKFETLFGSMLFIIIEDKILERRLTWKKKKKITGAIYLFMEKLTNETF